MYSIRMLLWDCRSPIKIAFLLTRYSSQTVTLPLCQLSGVWNNPSDALLASNSEELSFVKIQTCLFSQLPALVWSLLQAAQYPRRLHHQRPGETWTGDSSTYEDWPCGWMSALNRVLLLNLIKVIFLFSSNFWPDLSCWLQIHGQLGRDCNTD